MGLFEKKPLEKIIDMACTECGKEIRSDLPYCPHCKCNVVIPKEKSELNKVIKKELDEEVQENKKQILGKVKSIRKLWKNKEIIQLKTDSIAVLFKKHGYENEFLQNLITLQKKVTK